MRYSKSALIIVAISLVAILADTACVDQRAEQKTNESASINVIATTTIVGDIVSRIGGDRIDLHVLLPVGADPHRFEPAASDAAILAGADLVFINGLGLERSLSRLFSQVENVQNVISVSDGVSTHSMEVEHNTGNHDDLTVDPHVWMDPQNVKVWADNISKALAERIPLESLYFEEKAEQLKVELDELDAWTEREVSALPDERRKMIVDHDTFGYFTRCYGFRLSASVIPGFSSLASPSAKEIAALHRLIQEEGISTVFLGFSASPALMEGLAEDTGIHFVHLYTASLSDPGGPAADYFSYMRYNVSQIVDALK